MEKDTSSLEEKMTAQENSKESLVKITLLELIRGFLEYATDKGVKTLRIKTSYIQFRLSAMKRFKNFKV